jgi:hypothetical protein
MTPKQVALVQDSFAKVAPTSEAAAVLFYDRLFDIAPQMKVMFPDDMTEQRRKLMAMLAGVVKGLGNLEQVLPAPTTPADFLMMRAWRRHSVATLPRPFAPALRCHAVTCSGLVIASSSAGSFVLLHSPGIGELKARLQLAFRTSSVATSCSKHGRACYPAFSASFLTYRDK